MPEPEQASPSPPAGEPSGPEPSLDTAVLVGTARFGFGAFMCGLLGLLGLVCFFVLPVLAFAVPLSPVAVVLGLVGMSRARRSGASVGFSVAALTLRLAVVVR